MTNQPTYHLSHNSIREVIIFCEKMLNEKTSKETTKDVATGLIEWLTDKHNSHITAGYAKWLSHNMDFWKISRPKELFDYQMPLKPGAAVRAAAAPAPAVQLTPVQPVQATKPTVDIADLPDVIRECRDLLRQLLGKM